MINTNDLNYASQSIEGFVKSPELYRGHRSFFNWVKICEKERPNLISLTLWRDFVDREIALRKLIYD